MKHESTNKKDFSVSEVSKREEVVLQYWRECDIFKRSTENHEGDNFVFFDGPPFATGLPHYGHIVASTIKDTIPRYQTMRGKRVVRRWGWDCHGLPLENIIEKRLGLATKRDIEALGVKKFNQAAKDAVLEYADDWKKIIPRIGRFVDMENDYRTMDASYTESVWWVFAELHRKGLVYEGFKSMHLCPRCGTTLSNFEVNLGYKDIKDIAVTVRLPLVNVEGDLLGASLLVWTTTPWTLPGNMAAAIHQELEYALVEVSKEDTEERVLVAKDRLSQLGDKPHRILRVLKGEGLVGLSYEPPFSTFQDREFSQKENAWKIYHADYVVVGEEGTGAVHIAPAYGEEDMELAKSAGIPIEHHVGTDGRFKSFVRDLAGQLVKPKDDDKADVSHLESDIEIVKRLSESGKLFKKENISHSYPHCWRCDTPLLNYATTSWFVKVTAIRDSLLQANQGVSWVPGHIGENRFGKWLQNARDWAVSRQRYWGAPIPIWKKQDSDEYVVIDSLRSLQSHLQRSGNSYVMMRHAEALSNREGVTSTDISEINPLTEKGRVEARVSAETLRNSSIDLIIASPFERTRETALIVAETLGMAQETIHFDARLGEIALGEWNGKKNSEYHEFLEKEGNWYDAVPERGESWRAVKRRVGEFIFDIDNRYKGKRILIVSHNSVLRMLLSIAQGGMLNTGEFDGKESDRQIKNAETREFEFIPYPHNDEYELDFHRPYIDEFPLFDETGKPMTRVPDIFDCWFESGSMPYGEQHYPFENTDIFDPIKGIGFPADFIAEGVDQTRGWFYSLLVLGVGLFDKSPYKHVVVNGLVLAEDGKKMSKSLQNYPDPLELVDRIGADALRFYLLSSPLMRGEDLNFSEKDALSLQRKNIGRLHNVLLMYEEYATHKTRARDDSPHLLDQWIRARVNETRNIMTDAFEIYELDKATRPLESLIDDISVWYLRRSRDRLKDEHEDVREGALGTLKFVLKEIALLMAPVMPFYAEYLFLRVKERDDRESVHLSSWPPKRNVDGSLLEKMAIARDIVALGLEARQRAGIKVRQPLQALLVQKKHPDLGDEYETIMKEELNVKEVREDLTIDSVVSLDLNLTPALVSEGVAREFIRSVQDARKEMGLVPKDRIHLSVSPALLSRISDFTEEIMRVTGAASLNEKEGGERVVGEDERCSFSLSLNHK